MRLHWSQISYLKPVYVHKVSTLLFWSFLDLSKVASQRQAFGVKGLKYEDPSGHHPCFAYDVAV